MKTKILIILSAFISVSCGTINLYVNQDSSYSREIPLTVKTEDYDMRGIIPELIFNLKKSGYKIISYNTAKKSLNLDIQKEINSKHGELTHTVKYHTVYVMEIDYHYYEDFIAGTRIRNLSTTITDMRTGELIMSASFRGDRSPKYVIEMLVGKMNNIIL